MSNTQKLTRVIEMTDYTIEVLLQFPTMPHPYRVKVTPRQVHFLDRHAERGFATDGTVLYKVECQFWNEEWMRIEQALQPVAA
jgi:hypothetical protein